MPIGPGPHGMRAASRDEPHGGDSTPARPHESGCWPKMFWRVARALLVRVRIRVRVRVRVGVRFKGSG